MAYGIKIAKKEYDVKDCVDRDLILSSELNIWKIKSSSTFTLTFGAGSSSASETISHGLAYAPYCEVFIQVKSGGDYLRVPALSWEGGLADYLSISFYVDNANLCIEGTHIPAPAGGLTLNGYYYIYHDKVE